MSGHVAKFWMVYRENGSAPTYKHWSKEAATAEAERLATKHPGDTFIVLAAVGAVHCAVTPPVALKIVKRGPGPDDGIPF